MNIWVTPHAVEVLPTPGKIFQQFNEKNGVGGTKSVRRRIYVTTHFYYSSLSDLRGGNNLKIIFNNNLVLKKIR
jgi:hypothetical protein